MRAVPWADEAEQQLSRLALSGCELSADVEIFRAGLLQGHNGHRELRSKFEVARQASSLSHCASVRAVPWADEAEQQLSRLGPSGCELSADIHILKSGLLEVTVTDPVRLV